MPKLSSIYDGPYYCPYCSIKVGLLIGFGLQDEITCYSCQTKVRGYQYLTAPISLITLASLLADKERYERWLAKFLGPQPLPTNHSATEFERLGFYLTACILGEA